jgi:hypothetical protein
MNQKQTGVFAGSGPDKLQAKFIVYVEVPLG